MERRPRSDGDDCASIPTPPRQQQNLCTPHDYHELRNAYRFFPEGTPGSSSTTTWQERMTERYQSHLYREFVLADLTRYRSRQVGMRWRTRGEVLAGRGFDCCGNKHCPSYRGRADVDAARGSSCGREADEAVRLYDRSRGDGSVVDDGAIDEVAAERREDERLGRVPFGCGLSDFEVNFSYVEGGEAKSELVKLRLCLRCAPMLFYCRGGSLGARRARERASVDKGTEDGGSEPKKEPAEKEERRLDLDEDAVGSNSSESSRRSRRKKHKKRRRKKKRRKKRNECAEHPDDRNQRQRHRRRHNLHRRSRSCSSSSSRSSTMSNDPFSLSDTLQSDSNKSNGLRKRQKSSNDRMEREQTLGSNGGDFRDVSVRQRRKSRQAEADNDGGAKFAAAEGMAAPLVNSGHSVHADVVSDDADAIEAERMLMSSLVS